jgi:Flp pilus assembly protein TadG
MNMRKFFNGIFGRTGNEQMSAAWRKVARCESGQSLVETALGVSLCGILMLGAVEFGRLAYAGIEISDAARVGVEFGSQSHGTANDDANMRIAASQDAPDVSNLTLTSTHFCQCADGTSSPTCSTTDCSGRPILYVQVVTSASVDPLIYMPGLPKSYTLTGKAVMRVVQ